MPKQATEKCSWGPHCPTNKNKEEHKEDWDDDMQNQPRMHTKICSTASHGTSAPQQQNNQHFESQNFQHTHPQNSQQSFDAPNRYAEKIELRKEWEERIKRLKEKYNLD